MIDYGKDAIMDDRRTVDVAQFRRDMKSLGYGVSVRNLSEFSTAEVSHEDVAINAGSVLTPEHLAAHAAFYEYRKTTRVRDGSRVVTF